MSFLSVGNMEVGGAGIGEHSLQILARIKVKPSPLKDHKLQQAPPPKIFKPSYGPIKLGY